MVIRMRHHWLYWAVLPILIWECFMAAAPAVVLAEDEPPHLIQTVTEQDIYEGLLALGFLESAVLEEGNCEAAYENVKNCVVRLDMGNAYGSGIIWDMTKEQMLIVTNKHVLDYWDYESSYVHFSQNIYAAAKVLGVSEKYDIGFLTINRAEFTYEVLEQMHYVHWDMEAYQGIQPGEEMFFVGAVMEEDSKEIVAFQQGKIGNMWQYIDVFGEYMIYCYGQALPGMSGGGTFDAKGNFIGMVSGGTADGEMASVPLPVIIEAYTEISR